jgi:hypothetical protein
MNTIDCESFGYVDCDDRTCALTKELCSYEAPKMSKKFVDAFTNFMGYIQSMKEGEIFAWTDNAEKFNSTINELENFYLSNKNLIDLYENYIITSDLQPNFDKLKILQIFIIPSLINFEFLFREKFLDFISKIIIFFLVGKVCFMLFASFLMRFIIIFAGFPFFKNTLSVLEGLWW